MSNLNTVSIIGRWTKNLELNTKGAAVVANGTLAVDLMPGKDGEKKTAFIGVVLFGKRAENAANYCGNKGDLIAVQGHLQSRTWKDKNDATHYVTEVVAENTQFLNAKKSNTESVQQTTVGSAMDSQGSIYEDEMTPVDDGDIPF